MLQRHLHDSFKSIFLLSFTIWISNLHIVICCPYLSYDEAVLPIESQQTMKNFQFEESVSVLNNIISIGYWTFNIPYFFLQYYPKVEKPFQHNMQENGQFISLIKFDESSKILNYVKFDLNKKTINHIFTFLNQQQDDINFEYHIIKYESIWYFTLITFDIINKKMLIQMTDQEEVAIDYDLLSLNQIVLGGRGQIDKYNLNIFKGRISQLYISENKTYSDQYFSMIQDLCKIPNEVQGEQKIILVDGFKDFDGTYSLSKSFKQVGNYYLISGWVRYDVSRRASNADFTLIRLSTFLNHNFVTKEGDEIFIIQALIDKSSQSLSSLYYIQDSHTFPIYGYDFYTNIESFSEYDNSFYEALVNWHFIKVEYSITSTGGQTLLQMDFTNEIGTIFRTLNGKTITNTIYYLFLGKDLLFSDTLQGYIYDFQMTYNYEESKFYQIESCHYSCLKCNGPFYNNCVECQNNQNREYLSDSQACPCKYGFIDKGFSKCEFFFEEFYQVQQKESFDETYMNCYFGYFSFPNNLNSYICIECPQKSQINYLCIDCIHNPNSWYQNPVCQEDFIQFDGYLDGAYIQKFRKATDIDLYFIDLQGQLTLHQQYFNFCDPEIDNSNCYLSDFKHLGQQTYIKCKPNYFYSQGQCQYSNPFCLEVNVQGVCQTKIEGMYELNGQYYQCPINCLQCQYNLQQHQIECENCIQGYGLLNDKCIQCGIFCKTCQNYFDPNLQQSYLKCYKCIDDSLYFFSFDAINCQENTIKNCQYAFQAVKDDLYFNTLDLYFIPRNDSENLQIYCARCDYNYIFVFSSFQCLHARINGIIFGYAEQLFTFEIDQELREQLLGNEYVERDGQKYTAVIIDGVLACTSEQIILATDYLSDSVVEFSIACGTKIVNCDICIKSQYYEYGKEYYYRCLICKIGYYSERFTNQCTKCPEDLNCISCYHQQILNQDNWRKNIRAFYKQFIEKYDYNHQYTEYGQSQNRYDYEVKCDICAKGFELVEGKCIQFCPESCVECLYSDGIFYCAKCQQVTQGRSLSYQDNSCLQCPYDCALCRKRSDIEKNQLNPLFLNDNFDFNSNQCFKSFDDKNYYYDNFFGRFIDCEIHTNCQQTLNIKLNLICQNSKYQSILNSMIDEDHIRQFKKQNIRLDDLISGQSFQEFENDQLYSFANQEAIKTILIEISSSEEQVCDFDSDGIIQQIFSKNIFTAINIYIKFSFQHTTIFQMKRSLNFINFKEISMQNLKIVSIVNDKEKELIFSSVYVQRILLNNVSFSQNIFFVDQFSIIIKNMEKLDIQQVKLYNIYQENVSTFIEVLQSSKIQKQITFNQLQIKNTKIENQLFLFSEENAQDQIYFNNLNIAAEMINFSFISHQSSEQGGTLVLKSLLLNLTIFNSILFQVKEYKNILANEIEIQNSKFLNTSLFLLNYRAEIADIFVLNSNFQNTSIIIQNYLMLKEQILNYTFCNVQLINNVYDSSSRFIFLKRYSSEIQYLNIQQLIIENNSIPQDSNILNYQLKELAFLYFELDYIQIFNIQILRSYSLAEVSINNAKMISIQEAVITQSSSSQFKSLYSNFDCLKKEIPRMFQQTSLQIFGSKESILQRFQVYNSLIFDSPIIYYQSAQIISKIQRETLIIQDFSAFENSIIQQKSNVKYAILCIQSSQQTQINITNFTFSKNILTTYITDYLLVSALLLNIEALQGEVFINNGFIDSNVIFNSSNSIFYLNLKNLTIDNCTFYSNNIFNYENVRKQIVWGYQKENNSAITQEDMSNVFKIKSDSGNGIFAAQNIHILNSIFNISQGAFGGAFQLIPQLFAQIKVSNSQFFQTSTLFSKENEAGGSIYLDGTSCQTLEVKFNNLKAFNITSRYNGGFLYIKTGTKRVQISMANCQFMNIYALIGSVFFLSFSNVALEQQNLIIQNLTITNTQDKYLEFYQKFSQKTINSNQYNLIPTDGNSPVETSSTDDSTIQISSDYQTVEFGNRSLFYIYCGNLLKITNLTVSNIFQESLFIIEKVQQIKIFNSSFQSNSAEGQLIKFTNDQTKTNEIVLKNIYFYNNTLGFKSSIYCLVQQQINSEISFKCPTKDSSSAPIFLSTNPYQALSNICIQQLVLDTIDTNNSGMVILLGLNENSIIRISNVKFIKNNCTNCYYGLIGMEFGNRIKNDFSKVEQLTILNSFCGLRGCFVLIKQASSDINLSNQQRILQNNQFYISSQTYDFKISKFLCKNNTSGRGTCFYAENIKTIIENSQFITNFASEVGGSILIVGQEQFILQNCEIEGNTAQIGGGLALLDQQLINYQSLGTYLIDNLALSWCNDSFSKPTGLTITLSSEVSKKETISIDNNKDEKIDTISEKYLLLPSGQKISEYQIFHFQTKSFIPFQKNFRILALNQRGQIIKNLQGSLCTLQSRLINTSIAIANETFDNNYTSFNEVYFNNSSQDYNLDDMIIYFDSNFSIEVVLQLQIFCDSVSIPIYSKEYPYGIIKQHNNYKLRVNIRSYPCQYGEIKAKNSFACIRCDGDQGMYSLVLNAEKCLIKDDVSTYNVTSVQLNLKSSFWRPYFDSSEVSYCTNSPENCLGGWIEGDASCFAGHIGALCESCDIYDIRGEGHYSISGKLKCIQCTEKVSNILVLTLVSAWVFLSTFISVVNTRTTIINSTRFLNIQNFSRQKPQQSAVQLKLLTNYLQIIGSLSTFKLSLPNFLDITISSFGSPTKQIVYSLDCFLKDFISINIQYIRVIWQIAVSIIYINGFIIGYILLQAFGKAKLNFSVISTSLIYIYIYNQPSLIGSLIDLISFKTISDFKWISANLAFRYDTESHYLWMIRFCVPLILVSGLLIPLLLFFCLYVNRVNLSLKKIKLKWGYLYIEYKHESYFWEIVKIIQKELMILCQTYYENTVVAKAILLQLILIIYLELNSKYHPYNVLQLNKLDYFSTQICLISMALSIGIYQTQESNHSEISTIFIIALIILNLHLFLKFIINLFLDFFKERSNLIIVLLDQVKFFIKQRFPFLLKLAIFKRLLEDQTNKRKRIQILFQKLRQYLMEQAKEIIQQKLENIGQKFYYQSGLEQKQESLPQTVRSQSYDDKLALILTPKKQEKDRQASCQSIKPQFAKNQSLRILEI